MTANGLGTHADTDNGNAGSDHGSRGGVVDVADPGVSSAARSRAGDAGNGHSGVSYELTTETAKARAILENMRDLLGDDADLMATTLEGETEIKEAISRAIGRILELNGMMDGIVNMIASLKDRGERLEKQRDNLRALVGVAMETANLKRIETPLATASLRVVAPKAEIIDESAIPAKFWKPQEPRLDKKAVLDALKDKQAVPGATLGNGGMTVSLKVN